MYQPWRALATIINLCLTGKTSAFERPRAPVLQILWGVVNKANIDYAERIWEEFTQCIHSFIEDKMNLALHTEGKKKVNPLVIPGVRFTKLIINHLQSIHKFHKRPGSPLHLPYEEAALGYLKFSFKNTKRVRFGMAIPNTLISEDIRSAPYYPEYVAKVTKYQRYLAGEVVSDDEAPAPKPAPAKPQEKKRKLVMETTGAPSPAKRSKAGKVVKKRTLKISQQLVDEFVDEGVLADEPRFEDEEADIIPKGKGKVKVGEEQAAQVLLNLQTPKKKNPTEQFIFQRRTLAPTIPSSHEESSSLYVELSLTDSETESDNEASREGQAGSDPGKLVEGQAGSNPGVAADSRIQPSHVVHDGPNLEHMNLEENLKLPTEGEVRLEEHASSNRTLSSLQNLDKDLSFTNQFLAEKSQPDEPEKTNNETEVQSMVIVPIHQDTSLVPLMTTPVIDLTISQLTSTMIQASIPTSTVTATTTTTPFPPPPHQPQQGVSDSIIIQLIGELKQHMTDPVEENQALEERAPLRAHFKDLPTYDMKEILLQRVLEENYDKGHEDHRMACKALQTSILRDESEQFDDDNFEEHKKMKSKQDSPKTPPGSPPPPPPPSPPFGASGASGSSKTAATTAYIAWTTTTTRFDPSSSSIPKDVFMHEESDFTAQDMVSDNEDIGSRHIPRVNLKQDWFKPLSEDERPATPKPAWYNISRPLPLGGPPSHVMIQTEFFFNRDLDYLRFGSKGDRIALSITKMKAAYYPDVGLEQMVPDQMWIKAECMYDIFATYGISHWWFKRQKFYIDRHSAETNRRAIVRTHMRILSVVSIDVFSIYEYDYMKQIVLQRAVNQEYTIAENDFKDLYPSDFEDLLPSDSFVTRFEAIMRKTTERTLRRINDSVKEVVSSSVKHAMRAPLRARFKDLPTSDMKEILLQRMLEENYDKGNAEHRIAYEALQGSIHRDEDEDFDDDKAQVETKKKGKQDSPKPPPGSPPSPPPPPPPPSGASGASGTTGASDSAQAPPPPPPVSSTRQEDQSTGTAAPSSSKTAASAECSAWTTTDSQTKPLQHEELTDLVLKLSDKIGVLEKDLQQTKKTYSTALTKLVLKVKKLEKQVKSGKARKRARIDEGTSWFHEHEEVHGKASADTESALKSKDKGKEIMTEPEPSKKLKKIVQVQLSVDEELARKIQEEDQAKDIAE
ncbi:hypothetical protein Tco_0367006 [Tanacetum coccineum]